MLAIFRLADLDPVVAGVNVTSTLLLVPAARVTGSAADEIANEAASAPVTEICEITRSAEPEFVSVIVFLRLVLMS